MISKLKLALKDPTLAGTFIVTVGVFAGNIFSYLLQVGLGHLLSIEDFGIFNAFLSLSVIFGIPAGAIAVALVKKVSEYLAKNDFFTLRKLFWSLSKISLGSGLLLSLLFVALNNRVAEYLNVPQDGIVLVFAVFLAFSFLNVAPPAYLQGLLRFKAYAFLSLVTQFFRLIVPLGLVYLGFAVEGAYSGLVIVGLLSFAVSVLLLNKNLRMGSERLIGKKDMAEIYKKLLLFSVPVFFISSGIALLNNIDIILVKHFFSPYDAGIYSGVVTMCKIFLFGASIVQVVMFPQISHLYASGLSYRNRFLKFFSMQLLLIVGGLTCFALFASPVNQIMFGGKFAYSVPYMPLFASFVALYILLTFFSMFLLAISKTRAYVAIIPACALQYGAIILFHANLYSVIKANILATGIACSLVAIYVVRSMSTSSPNNRGVKICP